MRYPDIKAKVTDNCNVFAIMTSVTKEMARAFVEPDHIAEFMLHMRDAGTPADALTIATRWVNLVKADCESSAA